jgi:SagB-type dehydrogenase family enzyme
MMTARYVTSPSIVVVPSDQHGQFHVYDFLTKDVGTFENVTLYWLSYFKEAKTWAETLADHPSYPFETLWDEFHSLRQHDFVQLEGDEKNTRHLQFKNNWEWDLSSGLFHFTVTDSEFVSPEESRAQQLAKKDQIASPDLQWPASQHAIDLAFSSKATAVDMLRTMAQRRTNRTSAFHALSANELGTCLFAGLGITAFTETDVATLPLGMTPSGGARNPYEAYVFLKRSEDLPQGVYRYNASEHKLDPLDCTLPQKLAEFVGDQAWVDDMAAVVVLVAYLERTMWKYPDPNAYRVVLIEAGHIVQNVMLAATSLGLTVCPTAALSHSRLSAELGLTEITQTPMYVFTLDRALPYPDPIVPNPKIARLLLTNSQAVLATQ